MAHHLAQVNVARLSAPLDSPELAEFLAALDPVNAVADAAPGFIWRLQTEDGNATAIQAFDWDTDGAPGIIVNLSVWRGVEDLADFVYGDLHRQVLRQRRSWFERMTEAHLACWWVGEGHRPSTDEAEERVRLIRRLGPTPESFSLRRHFPPTATSGARPLGGRADWLCRA